MSKLDRYEDKVWDRFFDEVAEPVKTLTRKEVQEELKQRRVDVTNAVARVHQAVASARARAELDAARAMRLDIVERLTSVVAPEIDGLRERLGAIISGRLQGSAQAAYFRKLEEAADDDDLRGLMDDIERLDALAADDETETDG